jgi:hypothetical protein
MTILTAALIITFLLFLKIYMLQELVGCCIKKGGHIKWKNIVFRYRIFHADTA